MIGCQKPFDQWAFSLLSPSAILFPQRVTGRTNMPKQNCAPNKTVQANPKQRRRNMEEMYGNRLILASSLPSFMETAIPRRTARLAIVTDSLTMIVSFSIEWCLRSKRHIKSTKCLPLCFDWAKNHHCNHLYGSVSFLYQKLLLSFSLGRWVSCFDDLIFFLLINLLWK